jgi:hypothetical protein
MVEYLVLVDLFYKVVIPGQQMAIHQSLQQLPHSVVAVVVKATSDTKQEVVAVVVVLDMTVQMQRPVHAQVLEHRDKETMEQHRLIQVMAEVRAVAVQGLPDKTQFLAISVAKVETV